MPRQREKLREEDFYNWWLQKYHNTTIQEIIEKEPELCKTLAWYKKYPVTQEQHDEWYTWAIDTIAKYYRISKKLARWRFAFDSLNVSPYIIKEDEHTD
jgi:hypothetical protein